jgi:hypothetical protein
MPVTTLGGTWTALRYAPKEGGAEMELEFQPNKSVNAKKIGLIQNNARYDNNTSTDQKQLDNLTNPMYQGNAPVIARGERTTGTSHIDRSLSENNPVYGAPSPNSGNIKDTKSGTYTPGYRTDRGNKLQNYQLGHQYKDLFHKRHTQSAKLYDAPLGTTGDGGMHFEVTAVGLEGKDKGRFFGSVKWGYSTVGGNVTLDTFEVASLGTPSQEFNEAGARWNTAHASKANSEGQQELVENLKMPTTNHRTTLQPDELDNLGAVGRKIDDLEAKIAGHELTGIDLQNAKWELQALKSHRQTLLAQQHDH